MVVPYAAGGGADAIARIMAQGMGDTLGQSFIVDNRGGAGGMIGAEMVARAVPDGYTILMAGNPELTITPWLQAKANYSADRDFIPVTLVSQSPNIIVMRPGAQKISLKQALDAAGKSQGGITIATPGSGSAQHIAVEMLKAETGLEIIHVPYKGAGPATIAVLGGEVAFALVGAPPALPHIQSNKLAALAVTQPARSALLPDVSTLGEALGIMGDEDLVTWYGLLVPHGTSGEAVKQLEQAAFGTLKQPGMREKFATLGTDLTGMPSDEFTQHIKKESARFRDLIGRMGLAGA